MADLIITIDGPAASGKSTAARLLAQRLDASFLDTGAMYRAVTLAAMQAGVDLSDEDELLDVIESNKFEFSSCDSTMIVCINGIDVTEQIRSPQVTANARYLSSSPKGRARLVKMQRRFAADHPKIVTEGRDQGTVAFPHADIKFYLIADLDERAERRQAELHSKDGEANLKVIKQSIEERDASDENRAVGPLKPAENAVIIDTTHLTIEGVLDELLSYVRQDPHSVKRNGSQ
ncbi:MAG: (d)CMP kinase [Sedimentisphaerales bacterium]|nr:(d)CMP kinase [Sedimentisphaerales bacterium]